MVSMNCDPILQSIAGFFKGISSVKRWAVLVFRFWKYLYLRRAVRTSGGPIDT
jgi:hypothetical protein